MSNEVAASKKWIIKEYFDIVWIDIYNKMYRCKTCGAICDRDGVKLHRRWHLKINQK